ncbi:MULTISPECIES: DNA -binding domain-containing protein [unclassified Bradyrhizobium]|uniref:DNA -binding domain-containing protein n=1 Tax=unclassified Bradyrhizobium TaxID=2631580 RepID=UPI002FE0C6E2
MSFQKPPLIKFLHAFDLHGLGGGPQDVAAKVLASDHTHPPSVEWKDSHARRKANRVIHDFTALQARLSETSTRRVDAPIPKAIVPIS